MPEDAHVLLFIEIGDGSLSTAATQLFAAAAQKYDLIWTASNYAIPAESTASIPPDGAKNFQLVICLGSADEQAILRGQFNQSHRLGEILYWPIARQDNPSQALESNINALIVKLIMKGGKRAATEQHCNQCRNALSTCSCSVTAQTAKSSANVRVSIESKGRGGKKVTIISGLNCSEEKLTQLAKELKQHCGTGGTTKEGKIEIQGDQRDRLVAELNQRGFKAKRAGG